MTTLEDRIARLEALVERQAAIIEQQQKTIAGLERRLAKREVKPPSVDGRGSAPPPLRYPGHYYDKETELNENWNRYFDPRNRYLSPEPMLQQSRWVRGNGSRGRASPTYSYAYDNPTAYIDRDGLDAYAVFWTSDSNQYSNFPHTALIVDEHGEECGGGVTGRAQFDFSPSDPLPFQPGKVGRDPIGENGPGFGLWLTCSLTPDEDRRVKAVAEYFEASGFGCYQVGYQDCRTFVLAILDAAGVRAKCNAHSSPWYLPQYKFP